VRPWSHLIGLSYEPRTVPPPGSAQLLCLVTDALDGPEHKHARRRGVHPCRSELAGTVRDRPDARQLTDGITLSDRAILENARRAAVRGGCAVMIRKVCGGTYPAVTQGLPASKGRCVPGGLTRLDPGQARCFLAGETRTGTLPGGKVPRGTPAGSTRTASPAATSGASSWEWSRLTSIHTSLAAPQAGVGCSFGACWAGRFRPASRNLWQAPLR
jgi:hypothetical protein